MGVENLWKLVSVCGRRIDINRLQQKRLAVDISIWLVQFLKVMQNGQLRSNDADTIERMVIVGILRRIMRLLYNGIKPVFVFDGPAPTIKRLTVQQRAKSRIQSNDSVKRIAEKILLTQLKMKSITDAKQQIQLARQQNSIDQQIDTDIITIDEANDNEMKQMDPEQPTNNNYNEFNDIDSIPVVKIESDTASSHIPAVTVDSTAVQSGSPAVSDTDVWSDVSSDADMDNEIYVTDDKQAPSSEFLNSLPAVMRERVIEQTKERMGYDNRRKLIKIDKSGDYINFSEMQMQSFVKRATFNAQVNRMHTESVTDNIINGVKANKIASEPTTSYLLYHTSNKQDDADTVVQQSPATHVLTDVGDDDEMEQLYTDWACAHCSYLNDANHTRCEMCNSERHTNTSTVSDDSVDTVSNKLLDNDGGGFELPNNDNQSTVKDTVHQPKYNFFHSAELVQKDSVFQGHVCELHSKLHVDTAIQHLQQSNKLAHRASCLMYAYRIVDDRTKSVTMDSVDGGERRAGSHILQVLKLSKLNNVLVVVSRYFGGTNLGYARFDYIKDVARDALAIYAAAHTKQTRYTDSNDIQQPSKTIPNIKSFESALSYVPTLPSISTDTTSNRSKWICPACTCRNAGNATHCADCHISYNDAFAFQSDTVEDVDTDIIDMTTDSSINHTIPAVQSQQPIVLTDTDNSDASDVDPIELNPQKQKILNSFSQWQNTKFNRIVVSEQKQRRKLRTARRLTKSHSDGPSTTQLHNNIQSDASNDKNIRKQTVRISLQEQLEQSSADHTVVDAPQIHQVPTKTIQFNQTVNALSNIPNDTVNVERNVVLKQHVDVIDVNVDNNSDIWDDVTDTVSVQSATSLPNTVIDTVNKISHSNTSSSVIVLDDLPELESSIESINAVHTPNIKTESTHQSTAQQINTNSSIHTTDTDTASHADFNDIDTINQHSIVDDTQNDNHSDEVGTGTEYHNTNNTSLQVNSNVILDASTMESHIDSGEMDDVIAQDIKSTQHTPTSIQQESTDEFAASVTTDNNIQSQIKHPMSNSHVESPLLSQTGSMTPSTTSNTLTEPTSTQPSFRQSNRVIVRMDELPDMSNEPVRQYQPYISASYNPSEISNDINDQLVDELHQLQTQNKQLVKDHRASQKNASLVTSDMIRDCKELLRCFGIPYIEAPGEAEAQCVILEQLGLVDGIISDDSDTLVFGGKNIYKNFFDEKKHAEYYSSDRLQNELGLNQQSLIHLALLLGCDYTLGVRGIGIVNAMEIVNAFTGRDAMTQFRDWCYSADTMKQPTVPELDDTMTDQQRADIMQQYRLAEFKYKHRNMRSNWNVSREFPNQAVIKAYLQPNVDRDTTPFQWADPSLDAIYALCASKLHWPDAYIHEQIDPVLSNMHRIRQSHIDTFYQPKDTDKFAVIQSSRLRHAVIGLTNQQLVQLIQEKRQKSRTGKSAIQKNVKLRNAATAISEMNDTELDALMSNIDTDTLTKHTRDESTDVINTPPPNKRGKKSSSKPSGFDWCNISNITSIQCTDSITVLRSPVLVCWSFTVCMYGTACITDVDGALSIARYIQTKFAYTKGKTLGVIKNTFTASSNPSLLANHIVRVLNCDVPCTKDNIAIDAKTNQPIDAAAVRKYCENAFGTRLSDVLYVMKELAVAYSNNGENRAYLDAHSYSLYELFRPAIGLGTQSWRQKGELDLQYIIELSQQQNTRTVVSTDTTIDITEDDQLFQQAIQQHDEQNKNIQ